MVAGIYIHRARKRGSVARKQPQSLVERQSPLERYELKEITWRDKDNWSLFSEESEQKNIMFEV